MKPNAIPIELIKMWQEARKQERKIRGMLVDYRRRAERRQDFYERIVGSNNRPLFAFFTHFNDLQKADPTQFLQLHGRRCRIHIDMTAAENPAIM